MHDKLVNSTVFNLVFSVYFLSVHSQLEKNEIFWNCVLIVDWSGHIFLKCIVVLDWMYLDGSATVPSYVLKH